MVAPAEPPTETLVSVLLPGSAIWEERTVISVTCWMFTLVHASGVGVVVHFDEQLAVCVRVCTRVCLDRRQQRI